MRINEIPKDIEFVEKYVNNFNCFMQLGNRGYCRYNVNHLRNNTVSDIDAVVSKFKIPRIQFYQILHSDTIPPTLNDTLMGLVRDMTCFKDFKIFLKCTLY